MTSSQIDFGSISKILNFSLLRFNEWSEFQNHDNQLKLVLMKNITN